MKSARAPNMPITAPMHWATTNIATELGAMPEKLSLQARAKVTAGLAKMNEEVKKKPVVIQAQITTGA